LTVKSEKEDIVEGLEAGADDYLVKPYTPLELKARIIVGERTLRSILSSQKKETMIDFDELIDRFGGDIKLLSKIAKMFKESYATDLQCLHEAIQNNDTKAVLDRAHAFKSSIGYFTADTPFKAALDLEKMGRSRDLSQADKALEYLTQQCKMLESMLNNLIPEKIAQSS